MKVYIVEIVPTKSSKSSYILGCFSTRKVALQVAKEEVSKKDAAWWTEYRIHETELKG